MKPKELIDAIEKATNGDIKAQGQLNKATSLGGTYYDGVPFPRQVNVEIAKRPKSTREILKKGMKNFRDSMTDQERQAWRDGLDAERL